jgi:carbamoyl-phosphate synthase large subunit
MTDRQRRLGIDSTFEKAYAKSQIEAGQPLPLEGTVFLSVRDADKARIMSTLVPRLAACARAIVAMQQGKFEVHSLQRIHA